MDDNCNRKRLCASMTAVAPRDKQHAGMKRKRCSTERDTCAICLEALSLPALCQPCDHSFDADCILRWSELAETCPLCKTTITQIVVRRGGIIERHVPTKRRQREQGMRFTRRCWPSPRSRLHDADNDPRQRFLERQSETALQRRRYVYTQKLNALYVGANPSTRFKSFTAADFKASSALQRKAGLFLRRELQTFPYFQGDDCGFLRDYLMNGVLPALDIQSAGAGKLAADFLGKEDGDRLLHELHCFLRSPFDTLEGYDGSSLLQYGKPLQPPWPIIEDEAINSVD